MDIVRNSVDIRARIGYLPQDARFYEHMTARQTLDYTAKFFYTGPQAEIDKRVNEMIELVGPEGKADRPIKGFSGGERQRLGTAQAEVNYPDLLILGEPAASLDPQGRRDVLEVMPRIRKAAAKNQLMDLLVTSGLKISNFGRKEQNLEDVFINIIERSQK